jgi:thioredoxin reductase (NADPH)
MATKSHTRKTGPSAPSSSVENIVILGGGPAGLTAAIYAARALTDPLVIEGEVGPFGQQPGGQLMLTTEVENYPGFPDGILGPELIDKFREQATRFGARLIRGSAHSVDLTSRPFVIETAEGRISTKALIIATGAAPKRLGVPGESEFLGMGVSTCATCDGAFFKDRNVAVVGGGDSAMEEALFLTRYATKVVVIHRRDKLRASKIMQERAMSNPKIEFLFNTVVIEILGEQVATELRLKNVLSQEEFSLPIDGIFIAIGHSPNSDIFKGQLAMDELGYIKTFGGTKTNIPGVFAAGDVTDRVYRQAITAAAMGCMAAIDAYRWLEENND